MLSIMESSPQPPTPSQAAAALADAQLSRTRMADAVAMPSWFEASLGAAVAVHLAATAVGVADGRTGTLAVGLLVFAVVAGVQLIRFRQLNGVRLGGFASRVVFGTSVSASLAEALGLAGAVWGASVDQWWLVALSSIAGGAGYVLSGRRWLRTYRAQPDEHARGGSLVLLLLLAAAAIAGAIVLVLNR